MSELTKIIYQELFGLSAIPKGSSLLMFGRFSDRKIDFHIEAIFLSTNYESLIDVKWQHRVNGV